MADVPTVPDSVLVTHRTVDLLREGWLLPILGPESLRLAFEADGNSSRTDTTTPAANIRATRGYIPPSDLSVSERE
jgi:hypothetical protein